MQSNFRCLSGSVLTPAAVEHQLRCILPSVCVCLPFAYGPGQVAGGTPLYCDSVKQAAGWLDETCLKLYLVPVSYRACNYGHNSVI